LRWREIRPGEGTSREMQKARVIGCCAGKVASLRPEVSGGRGDVKPEVRATPLEGRVKPAEEGQN